VDTTFPTCPASSSNLSFRFNLFSFVSRKKKKKKKKKNKKKTKKKVKKKKVNKAILQGLHGTS